MEKLPDGNYRIIDIRGSREGTQFLFENVITGDVKWLTGHKEAPKMEDDETPAKPPAGGWVPKAPKSDPAPSRTVALRNEAVKALNHAGNLREGSEECDEEMLYALSCLKLWHTTIKARKRSRDDD